MHGLSLFEGRPDQQALAAAQHASMSAMSASGRNYQSLLTLACLNAAQGNTAEAHQELLDAMSSKNLALPDAGIWYGFGRIFEQYGLADAAVSAYHRTLQLSGTPDNQGSNSTQVSAYTLAQMRLAVLAPS
jgi:tetratricopeptide (TPR) repeat protein